MWNYFLMIQGIQLPIGNSILGTYSNCLKYLIGIIHIFFFQGINFGERQAPSTQPVV